MSLGANSLSAGFGATEPSDKDEEEEGTRIVEQLKPKKPEGLCASPIVRAFLDDANTELGADIVAVVGDVICHIVLTVPPVTLTVAFIRFGLRKYCHHHA